MADIDTGAREKRSAATTSVLAAVGLTTFKIIVGIATGSLGILAEAAHSGLDLVAALMTFFAVRISARPADIRHPYGHGKVESLSALFETLLLLGTCAWIFYSAAGRLRTGELEIAVTFWSFAVMVTSIIVDVSRSRVLYRAARRYNSQALEADALHFSTDIWSSAVVIVGLIFVKLAETVPAWNFLRYGDSVAAIIVALIVVGVSLRLGGRTVQGLMDTAPPGIEAAIIDRVEALPGVVDCHHVRVRYSGPVPFVDIHILVRGDKTLREVHQLTDLIETVIQGILPNADVTVHPEPENAEPNTAGPR